MDINIWGQNGANRAPTASIYGHCSAVGRSGRRALRCGGSRWDGLRPGRGGAGGSGGGEGNEEESAHGRTHSDGAAHV